MNMKKAIDIVFEKLSKLTPEEFRKELDNYKYSDITNILIDSGALSVGENESEIFYNENIVSPSHVHGENMNISIGDTAFGIVNVHENIKSYDIWNTNNIKISLKEDTCEISDSLKNYNLKTTDKIIDIINSNKSYYIEDENILKWAA